MSRVKEGGVKQWENVGIMNKYFSVKFEEKWDE